MDETEHRNGWKDYLDVKKGKDTISALASLPLYGAAAMATKAAIVTVGRIYQRSNDTDEVVANT